MKKVEAIPTVRYQSSIMIKHPDIPSVECTIWDGDEGAVIDAVTMPPSPVQRPTARFNTRFADFELSVDGFQFGNAKVLVINPFRTLDTPPHYLGRIGSPDSLATHIHSSEKPSRASSRSLTRRSSTLGPIYNEIGAWTDYHFEVSPLPLVPEWRIPPQPQVQIISQTIFYEDPEEVRSEDSENING
jgi:hypothetical protein